MNVTAWPTCDTGGLADSDIDVAIGANRPASAASWASPEARVMGPVTPVPAALWRCPSRASTSTV